MSTRERHQQIKALLLELKAHLKGTKGDPRKDAALYLTPKPIRKKRSKKTSG